MKSPFRKLVLQETYSCLNKNGFESRKIKKLMAKLTIKMKIDKKNYSAFKENDSLNDKRLQELFDGIRKPAVITPPDIVSQCMVAIPMWLLYEMGLLVARVSCPSDRRAPRKKKEKKPVCPTGRPRKPVCPTGRQKVVKRTKQRKQKRRRKL